MAKFHKVFFSRHIILPVIHSETASQTLRNANIAYQAGCDGIFLINHAMPALVLLEIHAEVVRHFPNWWIGVNCLDVTPGKVFSTIDETVTGVWVDNSGIVEDSEEQPLADSIDMARKASSWQGLYFGGVAFKYQVEVVDTEKVARIASRYMDVVTTSGPATGQAARIDKIRDMKTALRDFPLALASGVTPDNVKDFLPFIDCVLVATGISQSFTEFNPNLVKRLVDIVRSY